MNRFRPLLVVPMALVLIAGSLAATSAGVQTGDHPKLHFNVFGTNKYADISDLKGKIVVVDFWATWCGPCMGEAAHMVELNKKYSGGKFQMLGISLDTDPAALRDIIKEKHFTWPMQYSGQGWHSPIAQAWGVNSIPQTFIIGPGGKVLWRGHPARIDKPLAKAMKLVAEGN